MAAMRQLSEPEPAMLVAGLIFRPAIEIGPVLNRLLEQLRPLGPRALLEVSEGRPFDFTTYYEPEMGSGLIRAFAAFRGLMPQGLLARAKEIYRQVELQYLDDSGNRQVNLDPGLLCPEKLVLASSKNFTHRIYIGRGVFAELTLVFKKGSYRPLEWTYPDYRSEWALEFWNRMRRHHLQELRATG